MITYITAQSMGIHITSTFKPGEDCTQGKAKKGGLSKMAVVHSKVLGESLFFDISSPSPSTFEGKTHWLLFL